MAKNPNTRKWYDEIVSGNRVVFVYKANGAFIGECSAVFEKDDPDYTIKDKRFCLARMIVKREYRNMGIGGRPIDFITDYARKLGYRELSLGMELSNENRTASVCQKRV